METKDSPKKDITSPLAAEKLEGEALVVEKEEQGEPVTEMESLDIKTDNLELKSESRKDELVDKVNESINDERQKDSGDKTNEGVNEETKAEEEKLEKDGEKNNLEQKVVESKALESNDEDCKAQKETKETAEETLGEEKEQEPVFDGTEVPGMEANRSTSTRSLDLDSETQKVVDKAVALKNLVKEKSAVAVSTFLRRLSGRKDEEGQDVTENADKNVSESAKEGGAEEASQKTAEKSAWNPLNYITMSRDVDPENSDGAVTEGLPRHIVMKGRIILYTRLECQDCKEARLFLHSKRLKYVEINIDVYPSRKLELEKIAGSSAVPKVFFNEILVGGLSELKGLDESGKLDEKIDYLISETPSFEAPLPPLSGEDDLSSSGAIDELALVVRKLRESIVVKDRFYKMRRFTSCFLGSEAVDFLSEDQYLEREEATEFGRKLAGQFFFQHVIGENLFEDGNHLYRFLDDDPILSECHNIPRGLTDVKPKPITEIASRLRFLSCAIFEAYASEDGRHVDYVSIQGSEEFARYLRIVEELHRVELQDTSREEKLAFFINLYNMMAIHAILVLNHPAGPLERRKLFGDFRYVVGGSPYSLSAIQNGILRGNQRPPYNLMKPFSAKDKRSKVALPYPEPLVHFALVPGNQSGPALRCYSPGNIDKELMESACNFLRSGGVVIDFEAKVASVSKILKWYSVDFGKNETEVLKFLSNYLDPTVSESLLEFLANSQLKVTYQPYDWRLNC